jgi:hypothetical protein
MSIAVELPELLSVAEGFGTVPMLLTSDPDGRPRAAATSISWDGVVATARAGRHSMANAVQRPLVSLLWPAPPGERFALLVDGVVLATTPDDADEVPDDVSGGPSDREARTKRGRAGGSVSIEATRAMLHVVAGRH